MADHHLLGAFGETMAASTEVQQIAEEVRRRLEYKMKQRFEVYDALLCRSQVVAGMNYLIKVHIDYEEHGYVHIRVFVPLKSNDPDQKASLVWYEASKKLDSPLEVATKE